MNELIINFTPTGMVPTKEMNPNVPISAGEIVEQVLACAELGVSIVHLHARDEDGRPTPDPGVFAEIIAAIRDERRDLIICVTTSGRTHPDIDDRAAVLGLSGEVKPDMASLTLGSLNFLDTASVNAPETIRELARRMGVLGIKPELEIFEAGMINYARYLMRKGLLESPGYFNLLFGNIATAQATEQSLELMLSSLPDGAVWALAGIGTCHRRVHEWAVERGGHVRVGLEDCLYLDEGRTRLASNLELVQGIVDLAASRGRTVARPAWTRRALGLAPMPRKD